MFTTAEALSVTAIGLHRTTMGSIERGETNPRLTTLAILAAGLQVGVGELVNLAEIKAWNG